MTEQKKGSHLESWRELAEDWGTLGKGYHCTPFSNVNIFATEVSLCPNQTKQVGNLRSHLSWALGGVTVRRRSAAHGCADAHTDRRQSDPSSQCLILVGYQGL